MPTMPRQPAETSARDATINLRASQRQRALIDEAAGALGKTRSEFMLETACREAQSVLLDRRYFGLDKDRFEAFMAALDASPADNPNLRRLLNQPAPWEQ